ncbi:TetR/AcrR family transcriptional regulator [Curtobacterium pusillum]|uniref:TetR/AcrR family transcriptional regulator n=1 Tax=Curtobacterium pusillum TaxID=69373 RepID=UPI0011A31345|nr:TetR/AcrR family transcriptional regulator [Curtobacterium pusillum]
MPRVVDHDDRRSEIIAKVWRLISEYGVDAVTTRRIAEETGYSNGLLRYYFPSKDSVIVAAFQHVFDATNRRAEASASLRGIAALRVLAVEILPLDEERLAEARVVIAFWQRALHSPDEAGLYAERMAEWRADFTRFLEQARDDGQIASSIEIPVVIDELLAMLMGAQILGLFSPEESSQERQLAQLDGFVQRLRH